MELHAIGFKKSGKKKRELENFSQLFKISVLLGLIVHLWLHMGRARSFWKVVGDSSKVIMSPWSEQGPSSFCTPRPNVLDQLLLVI